VLAGLTVVGCVSAFSSVLELRYGMQAEDGMPSLVVCGLVNVLKVIYLFGWLRWNEKFDEYF
jgi:hypothetical protein